MKRSITVEPRYFVCMDGVPIGSAADQFEAGEIRTPFPFRRSKNMFKDEFEAECAADDMRAHITEIQTAVRNGQFKQSDRRSALHWEL